MTPSGTETIKRILGGIPFTAELYWLIRQRGKQINTRFSLKGLQAHMPEIAPVVNRLHKAAPAGKKVFVFATLHYWIEHAAMLGMSLAAQGHKVTMGYLPYADWQKEINMFDLRRQNAYARKVLEQAGPAMDVVSFLSARAPYIPLPADLVTAVKEVTLYDT